MKNVIPIKDDEQLEVATRWVLKMDEGSLSVVDEGLLDEWLEESENNRLFLMEAAAVWDKTESLARLADLVPHEASFRQTAAKSSVGGWTWNINPLLGASLALVVIIAGLSLQPFFEQFPKQTPGVEGYIATPSVYYETVVGEQKTVLLSDGSEVVLNTNSELSVTFTSTARLLNLSRGEIFVRVAKDKTRPLSVFAGAQIVQAVGTEFIVEITAGKRVEVLVTEGKVVLGVQSAYESPSSGASDEFGLKKLMALASVIVELENNTVSAGESVTVVGGELIREVITSDGIEARLSWGKGSLIFRSEPLVSALQEVERYTTVKFVILDESLKTKIVSGRFKVGDVAALLHSLQINFNIDYEYDGDNRVLLSSLNLAPGSSSPER